LTSILLQCGSRQRATELLNLTVPVAQMISLDKSITHVLARE
jgi:hypothetical protein